MKLTPKKKGGGGSRKNDVSFEFDKYNGLSIFRNKKYFFLKFGSLFQAMHVNRIVKTDCFDQHCPSLNQPDAKRMTKLQKRTCSRCGKYHSTIKHKNAHMRVRLRQTTHSGHSESRVSEKRKLIIG